MSVSGFNILTSSNSLFLRIFTELLSFAEISKKFKFFNSSNKSLLTIFRSTLFLTKITDKSFLLKLSISEFISSRLVSFTSNK